MSDDESTTINPTSALTSNIETKGRNAYYYAHSKPANGPVWDQKEEPRLLEVRASSEETAHVISATPITAYAFLDEDTKLKIYIDLPNVGSIPKENIDIQFTPTSFNLTVIGGGVGEEGERWNVRLMFVKLYAEIENVKILQKKDRIVLTLVKCEEKSWSSIAGGY